MTKKIIVTIALLLLPCFSWSATFFTDGFESGDRSHTENGASWATDVTSPRVEIVTGNAHSGSYALRVRYAATALNSGYNAEQRFFLGGQFDEVYVQYYLYIPSNYAHRTNTTTSSNNKFFILFQNGATYSTNPIVMGVETEPGSISTLTTKGWFYGSTPNKTLSYETGAYGAISASNAQPLPTAPLTSEDIGKWIKIKWRVRRDTGTGDGAFQMWVDDELRLSATDLSYEGASTFDGYFGEGYLFGAANSGFAEQTDFYIDDVVFSDTDPGTPTPSGSLRPGVSAAGVTFR